MKSNGSANALVDFALQIERLMNSNEFIIKSATNHNINVDTFNERTELIKATTEILNMLPVIETKLKNILEKAKSIHNNDVMMAQSIVGSNGKTLPWKEPRTPKIAPEQEITWITKKEKDDRIKITENISINAIKIKSFKDVKNDGNIYYIEHANHFAVKIMGVLFHGNIGIVYTEEKNPEKIKDCKFASNCAKVTKCDFYHNPLDFQNSRDVRNYISNSFVYAPPTSKNRNRSRKFGSLPFLESDIIDIAADDIARFNDQVMHEILCAIVLNGDLGPLRRSPRG